MHEIIADVIQYNILGKRIFLYRFIRHIVAVSNEPFCGVSIVMFFLSGNWSGCFVCGYLDASETHKVPRIERWLFAFRAICFGRNGSVNIVRSNIGMLLYS